PFVPFSTEPYLIVRAFIPALTRSSLKNTKQLTPNPPKTATTTLTINLPSTALVSFVNGTKHAWSRLYLVTQSLGSYFPVELWKGKAISRTVRNPQQLSSSWICSIRKSLVRQKNCHFPLN